MRCQPTNSQVAAIQLDVDEAMNELCRADDAGSVRCTNGALISVSGCATLPVQAAVEGDVTTATKQIDNRIFGTEGSLLFSGACSHFV